MKTKGLSGDRLRKRMWCCGDGEVGRPGPDPMSMSKRGGDCRWSHYQRL